MKKLRSLGPFLLIAILLSGCTSHTEYGACIGIADDKEPNLVYKVSAWNLFLGIIGFELIAPPIFVLVDQFYCPVAYKVNHEKETQVR